MPNAGSMIYQRLRQLYVEVKDTNINLYRQMYNIVACSVSMRRNEPMTWSVTFANQDRRYTIGNSETATPSLPSYGDFIRPDKKYRWKILVKTEEETKTWDYLTNLDYTINVSADGGYIVNISGTDHSWLLMDDNRNMSTWRSTSSVTNTAKSIIESILTQFGVSLYNVSGLNNYTVKWLHFQSEIPLDVIKKILSVRWAEWRFDDDQFIVVQPNYNADPDFLISGGQTITNLSYNRNRYNVITQVTVRRTSEASKIAFEEEGDETEEHSINVNESAFPDGAINLVIYQQTAGGELKEIYFWSELNKGGTSNWYAAPPPSAKSMSFFFQPAVGKTRWWYHIIVKGEVPVQEEGTGGEYVVIYRNNTVEGIIGERRYNVDPIIEELIPNETVLNDYAQYFLKESAKKLEWVNMSIGLYVTMRPGHILKVTEYGSGLGHILSSIISNKLYVEGVDHDLVNGNTIIEAGAIRPTDNIVKISGS